MATKARHDENTGPTTCPICAAPVAGDVASWPFCSERCRFIDLGRWLDGHYAISRPLEERDIEQGD